MNSLLRALLRHALLLCALIALPLHAQEKPAAESKEAPKPAPGQEVDPAIIESIMTCLAAGLTPEWFKTWFVIRETKRNAAGTARQFEATFFVANKPDDNKGEPLQTCGAQQILEGVGALNGYLPEKQQRWTAATFTFFRDGRYNASYDYTPVKPAAKPAAKPKPAAKKKQEAAK
jgi:hypothetical protein